MIKQYIKQALRMIGENKLLSVISILGTALAICMIMVIVILYVVNTAGFKASPAMVQYWRDDRSYFVRSSRIRKRKIVGGAHKDVMR